MNRLLCFLFVAAFLLLQRPIFAGDSKTSSAAEKMTPQTRLAIMRDLNAERAFARTVFPRGEKGLEFKDGKVTPNDQQVAQLVMQNGFAAKPGDRVVITDVIVKDKFIVLELNGGPKKKQKWYQHLSIGGANGSITPGGAQKSLEANGTTLTVQFDNYVPEMTGEQLRQMLTPVLDFKALTEAEAYQRTLPPKVREAIQNHQILVGMDREMVVYAKGRPPKKIRDKDEKGQNYEEWIYGTPPDEVEFVRFDGPTVARLEIMSVDGGKVVRTEREVDLKSQETELAQKKGEPKPANAPSLLRPGEQVEEQHGERIDTSKANRLPGDANPPVTTTPNAPGGTVPPPGSLPPPGSAPPPGTPDNMPQWQGGTQ